MMTTREAAELIYDALDAAVQSDAERMADTLRRIVLGSDARRMFGVCSVIAEAGCKARQVTLDGRTADQERGEHWTISPHRPGVLDDPKGAFAAWFLIAQCNGDTNLKKAHFETLLERGPEMFLGGVSQLLIDVAGLVHAANEHQEKRQAAVHARVDLPAQECRPMTERESDVARIMTAAVAHDAEAASTLTARLIIGQSPDGLYAACCEIADYAPRALSRLNDDMRASRPDEAPWILDHVRPKREAGNAAQAFATEFLDAHCDGRPNTTRGLFDAMCAQGPEHVVESVAHLVCDAAQATMIARTSRKGPGGTG